MGWQRVLWMCSTSSDFAASRASCLLCLTASADTILVTEARRICRLDARKPAEDEAKAEEGMCTFPASMMACERVWQDFTSKGEKPNQKGCEG